MIKIPILAAILAVVTSTAYAQGQLQLSNFDNTSVDPAATVNGLFWLSTGGMPSLISQDFNAAFYGGTDSSSLSLLATFLLGNGTAHGSNVAPGKFVDPASTAYIFLNISVADPSAFLQVQAWTGNFNSYAAALSGGAPAAQSPIFKNPLGLPPSVPAELTSMPAMVLSSIPEPSTFVLVALGGVSALLLWRWRKCTTRPRTRGYVTWFGKR